VAAEPVRSGPRGLNSECVFLSTRAWTDSEPDRRAWLHWQHGRTPRGGNWRRAVLLLQAIRRDQHAAKQCSWCRCSAGLVGALLGDTQEYRAECDPDAVLIPEGATLHTHSICSSRETIPTGLGARASVSTLARLSLLQHLIPTCADGSDEI
jgi:hypothetical protein